MYLFEPITKQSVRNTRERVEPRPFVLEGVRVYSSGLASDVGCDQEQTLALSYMARVAFIPRNYLHRHHSQATSSSYSIYVRFKLS